MSHPLFQKEKEKIKKDPSSNNEDAHSLANDLESFHMKDGKSDHHYPGSVKGTLNFNPSICES